MHLRKAKGIYCILANMEERGNCLHNEAGDAVSTVISLVSIVLDTQI